MAYLGFLLCFLFVALWVWVSSYLFKIYSMGVEVYFNVVYKSKQTRSSSELRSQYIYYLTTLWVLEVISGFGTMITVAAYLKQ